MECSLCAQTIPDTQIVPMVRHPRRQLPALCCWNCFRELLTKEDGSMRTVPKAPPVAPPSPHKKK